MDELNMPPHTTPEQEEQAEQKEKMGKLLSRITLDVNEFYTEFGRPARSGVIMRNHRSAIARAGLDWHEVEQHLKANNLIKVKRHEKKNTKWYFPADAGCSDEIMAEMVEILEG